MLTLRVWRWGWRCCRRFTGRREDSGAVWGLAFLQAYFSRLRYANVAGTVAGRQIPAKVAALLPLYLLVDFVAWTMPLVAVIREGVRERW